MNATPSTVAPSRGRAIFYVVVIFIAGSIFGSALTIAIGRHLLHERVASTTAWNAEAMRRIEHRLDLTPEQRARVRPILAEMTQRLRESRLESRRTWITVLSDTRGRLRAELTPEQQEEFDEMVTRTRERFGRFLTAPPEPGDGPRRPPPRE